MNEIHKWIYVHYICFCHQRKTFEKLSKMILFYQKSSFCPRDFQIFVLPSSPLFSFLGHCWFYRRSWLMIRSKVYGIIMSLNWTLKTQIYNIWWSKVLILIFGQLKEYYIEKISIDKFGCPKANFVPLHWQGNSLTYSVLITALYLIWSKDHWRLWNKVGFQSLANHLITVQT